jgi:hypothetical protein
VRVGPGAFELVTEAEVPQKSVQVFKLTGQNVTLTPMLYGATGSYKQPNWAYRVTSDLPVVAYQFNPYSGLTADNSDVCTNDGSLLLASSGLDRFYYGLAYPPNVGPAFIDVVGTKDGTQVKVRPSVAVEAGLGVPALPAGVDHLFTLDEAEVLQLESSAGDLSGTYIEADRPVAVFGGNNCAYVPAGVLYCDHLEHQLFPLTTWGKEYVAARTPVRAVNKAPENDYFRIIASKDGTHVVATPAVPGIPAVMNAGQVAEVGASASFRLSADQPVMVGQFLAGHEATGLPMEAAGGDPSFALLPPIEQFMTSYVFLAPDKYLRDHVVITHPAGMEVMLDGAPVAGAAGCETEAFDAEWEITRCLIADFAHTIDAEAGVGITVWGYGGRVSYGYTGGVDLQPINPVVPE